VARDLAQSEKQLLNLPGLRKYLDRLSSEREKEHFRRHLRKYVSIYLPDCPWEVSTTNRYTIDTHEAAVTARKYIKKGEVIKYLSGTMVAMTPEEEKDLDLTRRDFSIVMSSRKKTPSLFLGPARFANHDCNANGKLVTRGTDGMEVVAARNIDIGDEITVSYGEDYFGVDNCECLCKTCEGVPRNGWVSDEAFGSPSRPSTPVTEDELDVPGPYSFRRKRKYGSESESESSSVASTPRKRRATERVCSKLCQEIIINDDGDSSETTVKQSIETVEVLATPANKELTREIGTVCHVETIDRAASSSRISSSSASESRISSQSTEATSVSQETPTIKTEANYDATNRNTLEDTIVVACPPHLLGLDIRDTSDTESVLSELSSSQTLDDFNMTVLRATLKPPTSVKRKRPATPQTPTSTKRSKQSPSEDLTPKPRLKSSHTPSSGGPVRIPGDHTLTPLLLAQPYDRWVSCQTCPGWFVQSDSYFTRKECPRCERHSKLYGYRWPKTEKESPKDKEERVMDHRTVHRFIYPDEEREVKRKGKGIATAKEQNRSRGSTPLQVPGDSSSDRGESVFSELEAGLRRTRSSSRMLGRSGRVTL
jgi:[histone H4]-N-methyl-L-lysine20 N-methyltransferase